MSGTDHLRAAGLDKHGVRRAVVAGHLHRKYRGVYAWGHPGLSLRGIWLAAVDACGPGAVLSHLAAACLWRLLRWEDDWPIDVTVPIGSGRRSGRGIRVHRTSSLCRLDVTERSGIPVTNIPRIIRDLERTTTPEMYRRALREAEFKGHRKGLPRGYVPTRSEFEHAMLGFCESFTLPQPRTRVRIGPYEADFLFEKAGLFVETDAWSSHGGSVAWENDHERDLWMTVHDLDFLRLTWKQVRTEPVETAAALRSVLERLERRRAARD